METHSLHFLKRIQVTSQDIDDIMVTALEGGITYWCNKADVIGEYLGEYASEQISRGGKLRLYDFEEGKSYVLTLNMLLNGISKAIEHNYFVDYEWVNGNKLDPCQIDADVADVIIQFALFGDVVYG